MADANNALKFVSGPVAKDIVFYAEWSTTYDIPIDPDGIAAGESYGLELRGGFASLERDNIERTTMQGKSSTGRPMHVAGGYASTPRITLSFESADLTHDAHISEMTAFDKGDASFLVKDARPSDKKFFYMVQTPMTADAAGAPPGWDVRIMANADVAENEQGAATGNPFAYAVNVMCNYVTNLPWVEALADATHGSTEGFTVRGSSPYPLHMMIFRGNASATTFDPTYTPVTDSADRMWAYTYDVSGPTRTELTYSGDGSPTAGEFDYDSGTVTLGDTLAADVYCVFVYMVNPRDVK